MSIYTYDNRFQLGLLADKAVINAEESAQKILTNVFENIRNMSEYFKNVDVQETSSSLEFVSDGKPSVK